MNSLPTDFRLADKTLIDELNAAVHVLVGKLFISNPENKSLNKFAKFAVFATDHM